MLALVVLAPLEPGLPAPGAADRDADLEQPAQRGPLAQLGAEDRRRWGCRPRRPGGLEGAGAGAASSWRSQTQASSSGPTGGSAARPTATARPKGCAPGRWRAGRRRVAREAARRCRRCCRCRRRGRSPRARVWAARASRTAGSQRTPSWLTRSAVTVVIRRRPRGSAAGLPSRCPARRPGMVRRKNPPTRRGLATPAAARVVGERGARRRASSACDALARRDRPRCRTARRDRVRTPGTRLGRRRSGRPAWPRVVDPPFSGKNASGSVCAHKCALLPAKLLGVSVEYIQLSHDPRPFDP